MPGPVRQLVSRAIEGLPAGSAWGRRLGRTFLALPADLDSLYFDNFAVFGRGWQQELLAPAVREELAGTDPYAAFHEALDRAPAGASLLDRLLYADVKTYLHELLMKQDQMSMAASIESRVPFLDHHLVEFAARLPARLKLRGFQTKWILREAVKGQLPASILTRRKMGFPVPFALWMKGPWRQLARDVLLDSRSVQRGIIDRAGVGQLLAAHAAGQAEGGDAIWSLLNLELWYRTFVDGEGVQTVAA